jgi:hypothetical protein
MTVTRGVSEILSKTLAERRRCRKCQCQSVELNILSGSTPTGAILLTMLEEGIKWHFKVTAAIILRRRQSPSCDIHL